LIKPGRKIITITFVLLALVLVGVYSYLHTRMQLERNVYEQRRDVASLSTNVLEEKLNHLKDLGHSLAIRPLFCTRMEEGNWDAAIDLMKTISTEFPFINRVILADTLGQMLAQAPAGLGAVLPNEAQFDWFQGVRKKWEPYMSGFYQSVDGPKKYVTAYAEPVNNNGVRTRGILVLEVDLNKLLGWTGKVAAGRTGFVYIMDQHGRVASTTDSARPGSLLDLSGYLAVPKVLKGKSGVEIIDDPKSGESQLVAYEFLKNYGWSVMVVQDKAVALAANSNLRFVLAFYSMAILLAGFLAWYLLREIQFRKNSEDELSKYVGIVDNSGMIIRNMDDQIIFWNRDMEAMYGWKKEEIIGKVTHELFSTRFPKPLSEIKDELFKTGKWQGELTHVIMSGEVITVSSRWYLYAMKKVCPKPSWNTMKTLPSSKPLNWI